MKQLKIYISSNKIELWLRSELVTLWQIVNTPLVAEVAENPHYNK